MSLNMPVRVGDRLVYRYKGDSKGVPGVVRSVLVSDEIDDLWDTTDMSDRPSVVLRIDFSPDYDSDCLMWGNDFDHLTLTSQEVNPFDLELI